MSTLPVLMRQHSHRSLAGAYLRSSINSLRLFSITVQASAVRFSQKSQLGAQVEVRHQVCGNYTAYVDLSFVASSWNTTYQQNCRTLQCRQQFSHQSHRRYLCNIWRSRVCMSINACAAAAAAVSMWQWCSPMNRTNNPQHHQRILNRGSSGHDSGTHSETPRPPHTPYGQARRWGEAVERRKESREKIEKEERMGLAVEGER